MSFFIKFNYKKKSPQSISPWCVLLPTEFSYGGDCITKEPDTQSVIRPLVKNEINSPFYSSSTETKCLARVGTIYKDKLYMSAGANGGTRSQSAHA